VLLISFLGRDKSGDHYSTARPECLRAEIGSKSQLDDYPTVHLREWRTANKNQDVSLFPKPFALNLSKTSD
jgi:hypothetical protein